MNKICGFRPTGRLHIGHYLSVIKPGLDGFTVLVADYHAPEYDPETAEEAVNLLERFGVPKVKILRQRDIFHALRYFRLLALAQSGDLKRMTQYKSATDDERTAHLFTYPVLMAHDVMGFEVVGVGDDQIQHLEYARRLIKRYNRQHESDFPLPKVEPVGGRVKDLRDPTKKMSKSSPEGCVFLVDPPEVIHAKLRKAMVDEEGLKNLRDLHSMFVGGNPPEGNQALKESVADGLSKAFTPARV